MLFAFRHAAAFSRFRFSILRLRRCATLFFRFALLLLLAAMF